MPTVSNDGPTYDIAQFRKWFYAYERDKEREQAEAREARRYYHGLQWSDEELAKLKSRRQPVVTSNRIKRKVDFLVGVEQRMRRDPKAYARNPNRENDADICTAVTRFVCDRSHWQTVASSSTHDGLVGGVGVVWVGATATKDGSDPQITWCDPSRFFYDPRSVKPDFTDVRYCGMHLWLDAEEAIEKWPDKRADIRSLVDTISGGLSLQSERDQEQQWGDFEQQRVRTVEIYYKKAAPTLAGFAWAFSVFTGSVELQRGWSDYVDEAGVPDNPYVAWSPYVDHRGDRYGVVRDMMPIQDEINHRRSKFLHLLNTKQIHQKNGSISDVDQFRTQAARPDGVLTHEGDWGTDVGIVDHSTEIQGQAELLTEAKSEIENLGPNPGLIGRGGGVANQSGRAILAQRDSGMTELSPVYDRNRDWKLRVYKMIWARTRQVWTAERWIRITSNQAAAQFVGINQYQQHPVTGQLQSQNVLAELDVDVILDEGPDVVVMREELLQQITQMGPNALGPLGKVVIELSNVPNKEQLLSMLDQASAVPPQMQQQQQQMHDLGTLEKRAKIDVEVSAAERNRAQATQILASIGLPPAAIQQWPALPVVSGFAQGQMGPPGPGGPPLMPPGPPNPGPGQFGPGPPTAPASLMPAPPMPGQPPGPMPGGLPVDVANGAM